MVTLDTWMLGWRPRDLQHAYLPFLHGRGRRELLQRPGVPRGARATAGGGPWSRRSGLWATQFSNPTVTWEDLAWLREQTALPIVLKGILHPDDARRARARRASTG